jgi:hypothetical protein
MSSLANAMHTVNRYRRDISITQQIVSSVDTRREVFEEDGPKVK